jgi:chromate transporter
VNQDIGAGPAKPARGTVREVAVVFLKLGVISFGGPAAHIALMRDEVVRRRKWVSDEQFLDLLGMTNLIPGPNSTEMTIHLGYVRAGWPGLVAGGACFILPATLIVLAVAWTYVGYGSLPAADRVLYGIKPVIIAVVVQAMWGLVRSAVKGPLLAGVGAAVLALSLLGWNEVMLLFGGGLAVALGRNLRAPGGLAGVALASLLPRTAFAAGVAGSATAADLSRLFLVFLKIGSILYGSGFVLLAFLRTDFVHRLGWLSDRQLLDSVAVGQFTPGPVFTTATFIGYLIGGWWGAVLATAGIFLPSFVFVALSHPLIPRIRSSPWTGALLDGVNVAALGLMAAVTAQLARAAIVDWLTAALAPAAAVALIWFRVNSAWLVLGGAAAGLASHLLIE